ncbi:uncharacterized protein [Malus domestica]|uniref:uncharacterized protein n=1 Tax=Malus domestica TaxID=3750 RepID=UPI003976A58F
MLKNAQVHVTDREGGKVWNVRERTGDGGLHLRTQLESSVSAAAATTLPQRNMDLLRSLCSAAHFPPKSHLKLFQFRTRDARRRHLRFCEAEEQIREIESKRL